MKLTISTALKLVDRLNKSITSIEQFEQRNNTQSYLTTESPIESEYNFEKIQKDWSGCVAYLTYLKSKIREKNVSCHGKVTNETIDSLLVLLPFYSSRSKTLGHMKMTPAKQISSRSIGGTASIITIINYDKSIVEETSQVMTSELQKMQEDIDYFNTTETIEINDCDFDVIQELISRYG